MMFQSTPEALPFRRLKKEESYEVAVNGLWRRCFALDSYVELFLAAPKPNVVIS